MCLHTCTWWHMTHAQWRSMFGCSLTYGDDRARDSEENSLWLEMSYQGKWWGSSWILSNTAKAGHSYLGSLECYRGVTRGVEWPSSHVWAMENHGTPPLDPSPQPFLCGILGAGESLCQIVEPSVILDGTAAHWWAGVVTCFSLCWVPLWLSSWPRMPQLAQEDAKPAASSHPFWSLLSVHIWHTECNAGSKCVFQLPQNLRFRILIFCLYSRNIRRWS